MKALADHWTQRHRKFPAATSRAICLEMLNYAPLGRHTDWSLRCFGAWRADLDRHLHGKAAQFDYTLSRTTLKQAHDQLVKAEQLIKELSHFSNRVESLPDKCTCKACEDCRRKIEGAARGARASAAADPAGGAATADSCDAKLQQASPSSMTREQWSTVYLRLIKALPTRSTKKWTDIPASAIVLNDFFSPERCTDLCNLLDSRHPLQHEKDATKRLSVACAILLAALRCWQSDVSHSRSDHFGWFVRSLELLTILARTAPVKMPERQSLPACVVPLWHVVFTAVKENAEHTMELNWAVAVALSSFRSNGGPDEPGPTAADADRKRVQAKLEHELAAALQHPSVGQRLRTTAPEEVRKIEEWLRAAVTNAPAAAAAVVVGGAAAGANNGQNEDFASHARQRHRIAVDGAMVDDQRASLSPPTSSAAAASAAGSSSAQEQSVIMIDELPDTAAPATEVRVVSGSARLSKADLECLQSPNGRLNDAIFAAESDVLLNSRGTVPFYTHDPLIPLKGDKRWLKTKEGLRNGRFLQVLQVNGNHWVLVEVPSLAPAAKGPSYCEVFDSLDFPDDTLPSYVAELRQKLQHLLPSRLLPHLIVRIHQPQLQTDDHSCGLFAAAWLNFRARGPDLFGLKITNLGRVRDWLLRIITAGQVSEPPADPVVHKKRVADIEKPKCKFPVITNRSDPQASAAAASPAVATVSTAAAGGIGAHADEAAGQGGSRKRRTESANDPTEPPRKRCNPPRASKADSPRIG